jgi:hypothetical protein
VSVLGTMPEGLVCRPIERADWQAVIECLQRGFPDRSHQYWENALNRIEDRPVVGDFPRYGFILDHAGDIVGVMLTLYFRHAGAEGESIRCNLSSWTVDPDFRAYAGKLIMAALRHRDVTFLSVTPAPVTRRVVEALRFQRFADGQHAFLPILSHVHARTRVVSVRPETPELNQLPSHERRILLDHAALGCDAMICITDGSVNPFVFKTRRVLRGLVPASQVIYCRSHADLSQCAGALGRYLLRKGMIFCLVDARAPVPGLIGRYFAEIGPKYFKGPSLPAPGDLAFTEFALFNE